MIATTGYIAKTVLTGQDAIASHVRWKIALLLATTRREPLSPRATHSIQQPDECSIRKWLLSPCTLAVRATPEYREALRRHEQFRREMVAVAHLINNGDFDGAKRLLGPTGTFASASTALANAIMALTRAVDAISAADRIHLRRG